MTYQGTCFGSLLWNTYFGGVSKVIAEFQFRSVMFADDLNIFKFFPRNASDATIEAELHNTRRRVHKWGKLNRVAFDPGKEQVIIIHPGVGSEDAPRGDLGKESGGMSAEGGQREECRWGGSG